MGLRGPPKKPTALKVIAGNPGKRPLPRNEPKPELLSDLRPPAWLSAAAKRKWKALAPKLVATRVMSNDDVDALASYCDLFVQYVEMRRELSRPLPDDLSVEEKVELMALRAKSEEVSLKTFDKVLKLLQQFGMTPSSRAGIERLDAQAPGSDWDEFERTA